MKALFESVRELIEILTEIPWMELKHILAIIRRSEGPSEANERFAKHGYRVRFNPTLKTPAAYLGVEDMIYIHPRLGRDPDLLEIIEHEMMHREQYKRVRQRGGNPKEVATSYRSHIMDPRGRIRVDRYSSHPHELQANARAAISLARRKGLDPYQLLLQGKLGDILQTVPPGNKARFAKYVWQMLQAEKERDKPIPEALLPWPPLEELL
jgi:hypothetical protein